MGDGGGVGGYKSWRGFKLARLHSWQKHTAVGLPGAYSTLKRTRTHPTHLLHRVARQHPEDGGHARVDAGVEDAAGGGADDGVVVGGGAADLLGGSGGWSAGWLAKG